VDIATEAFSRLEIVGVHAAVQVLLMANLHLAGIHPYQRAASVADSPTRPVRGERIARGALPTNARKSGPAVAVSRPPGRGRGPGGLVWQACDDRRARLPSGGPAILRKPARGRRLSRRPPCARVVSGHRDLGRLGTSSPGGGVTP
jgi:hypothetical protein